MRNCISILVALMSAGALADTIYVNGATGSDAWDGRCEVWDGYTCGPKATIQAGIDVAQPADEVLIANGVYTGAGNKSLDFGGKPVMLRSASGDPAACIIDCESDGGALYFHSGEGSGTVVMDLTLRRAASDTGTIYCYRSSPSLTNCTLTESASNNGGGIFCDDNACPTLTNCTITRNQANCGAGVACYLYSHPTLRNCTIADNRGAYGAGVWCGEYSDPTLIDCTITGNYHGDVGAALDCYDSSPYLRNCVLANNTTLYGGGAVHLRTSNARLVNCSILNNNGGDSAGGVYIRYRSNPVFTNCVIAGNRSTHTGGGVLCHYTGATFIGCTFSGNTAGTGGGMDCVPDCQPVLTNCSIIGNTATTRGGGVRCYESQAVLTNCLIAGNTAPNGGGFYSEFLDTSAMVNCTVTGNKAEAGGGLTSGLECSPVVTNCVLWGNTPDEVLLESGWATIGYSDVRGGWFGVGDIDADPLFVAPAGPDGDPETLADNDYRLRPGSPCVDAGDPAAAPGYWKDLDGHKRDWDGDEDSVKTVDMGAYEYGSFPFGDLNCDGAVNAFDIDPFVLALTDPDRYALYYPNCDRALADLDGDGRPCVFDIDPFVAALTGE